MLKKIGVVTALAGTFLLSSAFQSPAHAQSCNNNGHHHKLHQKNNNGFNHSWYSHQYRGYHFYWIMENQQTPGADSGSGQTTQQPPTQTTPGQSDSGQTTQQPPTQTNTGQSDSGQTTQQPPTQTNTGQSDKGQQGAYQLNQFEQQVFQLTNKERTSRGLQPLKIDLKLSKMARDKSQDMANNHYFSHQSPTYGSPFDMMKQYGISYSYAGENIAEGQRTPQEVVNAWMNSPGHRANILNAHYTHIGVGYVANGNIWTQDFTG